MAKEIEYKYKIDIEKAKELVSGLVGQKLVQGYINEGGMTTRVRLAGHDKAFLTLKGRAEGISRDEFEYEIPRADGETLLQRYCGGRVLSKTRYHVPVGSHTWDVDLYDGAHSGLATAEVELGSEAEQFERPDWVGADISVDSNYTNEVLARTGGIPTGQGS